MTVQTDLARIVYPGNGVTVDFPVPFRFLANSHIQLLLQGADPLVGPVTLVENTDYTLTGARNPSGGTATLLLAAPVVGASLAILRDVPLTQLIDYKANDPFPEESAENGLDQLTMALQQQKDAQERALTLAPTVVGVSNILPTPTPLAPLVMNAAGTAYENGDLLGPGDLLLRGNLADGATPGYGAALVNWMAAGAGAFVRNLLGKLRERPSVLDYISPANYAGLADGGYTGNVSAGFNAAIADQKDVFIPPGIYTLTDIVTIPVGYRLRGAGRRKTIIKIPITFNLAALGVFRFAAGADGGEISDLTIEFTQPDSAVIGDYVQYPPAIYAVGVPRFKVRNIRITQAWTGIDMRGNDGGAVIDDLELSAFNIGIDIDGALDTVRINNLHLWPFGIGSAVLTANQRTIYQEAYGVKCGKCDDFKMSNSLIFSVIKGLYFYESGSGYTFGAITNTALDDRGGLMITGDGRLTYAGGSMSMGKTDSWFVKMTGGNLGIDSVRFSVSALQAAGNGLIELSGGTLSMGGACLIEGAAHDKALVYAANAFFRATGVYFARNSGIAFTSPMVRIINSGGSLVGCYASAIGAGSGKFAQIDVDNAAGFVVRGNNLRGWSVQTPATSALANTMVDNNLGALSNKDTFCGYFSADGTTTVKLPTGWTLAKPGAGNYTITHNLSLAAATDIIPSAIGGLANITVTSDPAGGSANTLKLRSYLANTGAATDSDIHFIVRRFRN